MFRLAALITVIALCTAFLIFPRTSERRVALVIGNAAYQHSPRHKTAEANASDITESLRKLGFEVINGINLSVPATHARVRRFAKILRNADVGLLYYSGNMIQVNGRHYISPIETNSWTASNVEFQTVPLDPLLREMERLSRINLVFLDACSNPLKQKPTSNNALRIVQVPGLCRGISPIENREGMLIAYGNKPGRLASQMNVHNSPFTKALLTEIYAASSIEDILSKVRRNVMDATANQQIPWYSTSLHRTFVFNTDGVENEMLQKAERQAAAAIQTLSERLDRANHDLAALRLVINASYDHRALQTASLSNNTPPPGHKKASIYKKRSKVKQKRIAQPNMNLQLVAPPNNAALKLSKHAIKTQLQEKLQHMGCYKAKIDGIWGKWSRRALVLFSRNTRVEPPTWRPNGELLNFLKDFSGDICRAGCDAGSVKNAQGQCVAHTASLKTFISPKRRLQRTKARRKTSSRKRAYRKSRRKQTSYKRRVSGRRKSSRRSRNSRSRNRGRRSRYVKRYGHRKYNGGYRRYHRGWAQNYAATRW